MKRVVTLIVVLAWPGVAHALEETVTSDKNYVGHYIRNLPAPGSDGTRPARNQDVAVGACIPKSSGANTLPFICSVANTDYITPSFTLGGDLSGTPTSANVIKLLETGGPTHLTIGAWPDGGYGIRSGTTIIGSTTIPVGSLSGLYSSTLPVGPTGVGAVGAATTLLRSDSTRPAYRSDTIATTWFVDPANGSDAAANGCTTSATACASLSEVRRRWWNAEIASDTTITILGNLLSTDTGVWNFGIAPGKYVQIIGSIGATTGFGGAAIDNTLFTGAVTAFTAGSNTPAAQDIQINDTSIPTSYTASGLLASGVLFKRTNSTALYWYGLKDLGTKTLRTTVPQGDTLSVDMSNALTPGDTYAAYAMWSMPRQNWGSIQNGGVTAAVPFRGFGQVQVWQMRENGAGAGGGPGNTAYAPRRHRVWLEQPTAGSVLTLAVSVNCLFDVTSGMQWSFAYDVPAQITAGGMRGPGNVAVSIFGVAGTGVTFVSQGVQLHLLDRSYFAIEGAYAVHDTTIPAFLVDYSSQLTFNAFSPSPSGVSGKGNTSKLLRVDAAGGTSQGSSVVFGGNVSVPPFAAASTSDTSPISIGATDYAVASMPTDASGRWNNNTQFPSSIFETGANTKLTWGAVADGALTKRSGATLIGATAGTDYAPAGSYITALTGDVTAAGPGAVAATLATVNASPGTYTNATVTVNGKGLATTVVSGATPALASRTLTAGAGMTGGGDLSADRTFDVVANADATIVINANDIQAGVMQTANIAADAVTNAKLANMATARFKARITAGTGDPEDLTGTQATTLLDAFTSSLQGVAPASGGGTSNFLRADGTWAAPPGAGGAPSTATYITQTADGTLSNEQALGALGTGVMSSTATTGVVATTTFTTNAVPFGASSILSQDATNFSFDGSTKLLTLGGDVLLSKAGTQTLSKSGSGTFFLGTDAALPLRLYVNGSAGALDFDGTTGAATFGSLAGTGTRYVKAGSAGLLSAASATIPYTDITGVPAFEVPLTFSAGLTRATNTITSNLSTGVSGGQTAIGGTASGNNLTLYSNTSNDGKFIFGSTTGMTFNEATNQLLIGTNTAAVGTSVMVAKNVNAGNVFYFVNPNTGGSAYSGFGLAQSVGLSSGAATGTNLFSSGSTYGVPYTANSAVTELFGGSGNMAWWLQQAAGKFVWYTGTTYPNPTQVMEVSNAGVLTINQLGTGIPKTTSGAVGLSTLAGGGYKMLASNSGGTDFDGSDELRLDLSTDQFMVSNDGAVSWMNMSGGSMVGATNYDRVRGKWDTNAWYLKSEKGGSGTVRPMTIDADAANLTLHGDFTYVQADSQAIVIAPGGVNLLTTSAQPSIGIIGSGGGQAGVYFAQNNTIASGTSATLDNFLFGDETVTISGSTTTVPTDGFNQVGFRAPKFSTDATIGPAATVAIYGAPSVVSGAGSVSGYGFRVMHSVARFDGNGTNVFEVPSNGTGNTSAAVGRIPISVTGVGIRYLRYYNDNTFPSLMAPAVHRWGTSRRRCRRSRRRARRYHNDRRETTCRAST